MAIALIKHTIGIPISDKSKDLVASVAPSVNEIGVTTNEFLSSAGGDNPSASGDIYNDEVDSYQVDAETGAMYKKPLLPLSDSRTDMASSYLVNCVVFAGGQDEKGTSAIVEAYTSFSDYKRLPDLAVPRYGLAAASVEDNILFAGGESGSGAVNTIDVYTFNFTKRHVNIQLPEAVFNLGGVSFAGYAVFFGGRKTDGTISNMVVAFDKNMNTIRNIPNLSVARYNAAAAVVKDARYNKSYLLIAGGTDGSNYLDTIDVYDEDFNKLNIPIKLSVPRAKLQGASLGSYALFAGGYKGDSDESDIVEIFDYTFEKFTPMKLSSPRVDMAVGQMTDRVLFMGGLSIFGASNVVDVFELNASPTPPLLKVTYHWDDKNMSLVKYHWETSLVRYHWETSLVRYHWEETDLNTLMVYIYWIDENGITRKMLKNKKERAS